ncbi:MAG TPA: DUF2723 domain-containing protein [bacterium]|nr:DUF2723 domain-containing protein [bacterium]
MDNPPPNSRESLISSLLFLTVFGFALLGLNPTFYADDSPETITASVLLGIPHPPGYPLHTLLGHLFSLLPLSHYPFRVNLLSAVLSATVCVALYRLMRGSFGVSRAIAIPATLFWAVGATTFPAALSAKTGIYQMTSLLLLAILGTLYEGRLALALFLLGVSCANHWMSTLAYLPGIVLVAYYSLKRLKEKEDPAPEGAEVSAPPLEPPVGLSSTASSGEPPDAITGFVRVQAPSKGRVKKSLIPITLFLLGLSIYLCLPIRAKLDPALNWGEPFTWSHFLSNFFRQQYTGGEASGGMETWVTQGWLYLKGAFNEFDGLLLAALWGMGMVYFQDRRRTLGTALTWFSLVAATVLYLNLPHEQNFLVLDYTLSSHVFILLFTAWGLESLFTEWPDSQRKMGRTVVAVVLIFFAAFLGVERQRGAGQSHYTYVYDYVLNGLKAVPRNALYYAKGDGVVFPVWYFQWVEGKRPDLALVGVDGFPMDWVRRKLFEAHPFMKVPKTEKTLGAEAVAPLMNWTARQNTDRDLYFSYNPGPEGRMTDTRVVPYGIVMRGFLPGAEPVWNEAWNDRLWDQMRLRNLGDQAFSVDERTNRMAVANYAAFRNQVGTFYEDEGDDWKAKEGPPSKYAGISPSQAAYLKSHQQYLMAQQWDPANALYLCNLGNSLFRMGRLREAVDWYQKSVDQDPQYVPALFNYAVTQYQLKNYQEAGKLFERVLDLRPDYKEAKDTLGYLIQQRLYSR